jgi:hypothetical protein
MSRGHNPELRLLTASGHPTRCPQVCQSPAAWLQPTPADATYQDFSTAQASLGAAGARFAHRSSLACDDA